MSHPDPALVDLRLLADHPLAEAGTAALRMVAPGKVTAGRFGLVEYRLGPHSPGAAPHEPWEARGSSMFASSASFP